MKDGSSESSTSNIKDIKEIIGGRNDLRRRECCNNEEIKKKECWKGMLEGEYERK